AGDPAAGQARQRVGEGGLGSAAPGEVAVPDHRQGIVAQGRAALDQGGAQAGPRQLTAEAVELGAGEGALPRGEALGGDGLLQRLDLALQQPDALVAEAAGLEAVTDQRLRNEAEDDPGEDQADRQLPVFDVQERLVVAAVGEYHLTTGRPVDADPVAGEDRQAPALDRVDEVRAEVPAQDPSVDLERGVGGQQVDVGARG